VLNFDVNIGSAVSEEKSVTNNGRVHEWESRVTCERYFDLCGGRGE
jgi:hypothetical protein